MKKFKSIILSVLFAFIILMLTGCTIVRERKVNDAKIDATKKFNLSEVYSVTYGSRNSILSNGKVRRGLYYVFGKQDDNYILIVVPLLKSDSPYEASWPFAFTFQESIDLINSYKGINMTPSEYKNVEFIDDLSKLQEKLEIDNSFTADFEFYYIIDSKYLIIQRNHKCMIVGQGL